ncbi:MAG: dicarboxylate/amino acid:cation symporter [Bacteroidetes bacterium HGW-Bacteroidetes-19]|nr:MAG: dicarboxylate/amino acid:cation symporter [Bacteroidetes bacterium HGW-Bacteroidetes-19]
MFKLALHWQILIAMVFAFIVSSFLPEVSKYIDWIGKLFLNALSMVVIPLVLTSIVTSIGSLDHISQLKRIGIKTLALYVFSMFLAVLIGLSLVNLIKPGIGVGLEVMDTKILGNLTTTLSIKDILTNIIPSNIFAALSGMNMLGIIFVSILLGIFINISKTETKYVMNRFFNAAYDLTLSITKFIIKLSPIGVFVILLSQLSNVADVWQLLGNLGKYFLTVVSGLMFHLFITLSIILWLFAKVNPWKHLKNMMTPLITSFSSASSSATIPLTMEALEVNNGVSRKVTSITIPLGATINMNGTALLECVAVLFIAQAYGIELSFVQQIIVIITSLLAAIGTAGIPMAGLVMMAVILNAVGLPIEGIGLVIGVDRILDMLRTSVNVYGDTCVAVIVAKSEGETLKI